MISEKSESDSEKSDVRRSDMKVNVMYRGMVYRVRGIKVLCSVVTAVIFLLISIVGLGVWMLVSAYAEDKAESMSEAMGAFGNATQSDIPSSTPYTIDFNAPEASYAYPNVSVPPRRIPDAPGDPSTSVRAPMPDLGLFADLGDIGDGTKIEDGTKDLTDTNGDLNDSIVQYSETSFVQVKPPIYSDYSDTQVDYSDQPNYEDAYEDTQSRHSNFRPDQSTDYSEGSDYPSNQDYSDMSTDHEKTYYRSDAIPDQETDQFSHSTDHRGTTDHFNSDQRDRSAHFNPTDQNSHQSDHSKDQYSHSSNHRGTTAFNTDQRDRSAHFNPTDQDSGYIDRTHTDNPSVDHPYRRKDPSHFNPTDGHIDHHSHRDHPNWSLNKHPPQTSSQNISPNQPQSENQSNNQDYAEQRPILQGGLPDNIPRDIDPMLLDMGLPFPYPPSLPTRAQHPTTPLPRRPVHPYMRSPENRPQRYDYAVGVTRGQYHTSLHPKIHPTPQSSSSNRMNAPNLSGGMETIGDFGGPQGVNRGEYPPKINPKMDPNSPQTPRPTDTPNLSGGAKTQTSQSTTSELGVQPSELGGQMGELGVQLSELGGQMGELGGQQLPPMRDILSQGMKIPSWVNLPPGISLPQLHDLRKAAEEGILPQGSYLDYMMHFNRRKPMTTEPSAGVTQDGPPTTQNGPLGTRNGPPGTRNGPPGTRNGPPNRSSSQNGPPTTRNGSPGTRNGPPTRSGPPGTQNGPQNSRNGPLSTQNGPPGTRNGAPNNQEGPNDYTGPPIVGYANRPLQNHPGPEFEHFWDTYGSDKPPGTAPGRHDDRGPVPEEFWDTHAVHGSQDASGPSQTGLGPSQTGPSQTGPGSSQTGPGLSQTGPIQTRPSQTGPGLPQTGPTRTGPSQTGPGPSQTGLGPSQTAPGLRGDQFRRRYSSGPPRAKIRGPRPNGEGYPLPWRPDAERPAVLGQGPSRNGPPGAWNGPQGVRRPTGSRIGPHGTQNGPQTTRNGPHTTRNGPHRVPNSPNGPHGAQNGPHRAQNRRNSPYGTQNGPYHSQNGPYGAQNGPPPRNGVPQRNGPQHLVNRMGPADSADQGPHSNRPNGPQNSNRPTNPSEENHRPFLGPLYDIYDYSKRLASTLLSFPASLSSKHNSSRIEYMQNEVELLEDYNRVFQNVSGTEVLPDMFDQRPSRDKRLMLIDSSKLRSLSPFELSLITWTFLDFWEFLIEKVGTLSKEDLRLLELRLERLRQKKDRVMAQSFVEATADKQIAETKRNTEFPDISRAIAMAEDLLKHLPGVSEVGGSDMLASVAQSVAQSAISKLITPSKSSGKSSSNSESIIETPGTLHRVERSPQETASLTRALEPQEPYILTHQNPTEYSKTPMSETSHTREVHRDKRSPQETASLTRALEPQEPHILTPQNLVKYSETHAERATEFFATETTSETVTETAWVLVSKSDRLTEGSETPPNSIPDAPTQSSSNSGADNSNAGTWSLETNSSSTESTETPPNSTNSAKTRPNSTKTHPSSTELSESPPNSTKIHPSSTESNETRLNSTESTKTHPNSTETHPSSTESIETRLDSTKSTKTHPSSIESTETPPNSTLSVSARSKSNLDTLKLELRSEEFEGRLWDPLGVFSSDEKVEFMEFSIKVLFKFGRVYLTKNYALDCMMLLFCKDLNSGAKKEGMDGMAAKLKSVGLKVLTVKDTSRMDTVGEIWRSLTAWETLHCESMFPRCDGPKALEIVNDVALGSRKK